MPQDRALPPDKKISRAQREGLLWEASREYMRGKITAAKLKEIERATAPKIRSVFSSKGPNRT